MKRSLAIALRGYIAPLLAARLLRVLLIAAASLLTLLLAGRLTSILPQSVFSGFRGFIVMPGLPLFAVVMAETALRDGLDDRTLLHALLGPVSRPTLAAVRTLTSGLLLFLFAVALLLLCLAIGGLSPSGLPQELLALLLGSLAYAGLAGLAQLLHRRGRMLYLVLFFVFDLNMGRLPFALRNGAPSYHLRVLGERFDTFSLPISLGSAEPDLLTSSLVLLTLAVLCTVLVAWRFARKPLTTLC